MKESLSSLDMNAKGMDNTFPSDRAVGTSPTAIGTTPTRITFDSSETNEVLCSVEGDTGKKCYMHLSSNSTNTISAATGLLCFTAGSTFSVPNVGLYLDVVGDDASIKLRMFYSASRG